MVPLFCGFSEEAENTSFFLYKTFMQTTDTVIPDYICKLREIDLQIILPTLLLITVIASIFCLIIFCCIWRRIHRNIKDGKYKGLIPVQEVYVVHQNKERGSCGITERKRLDPCDSVIIA